MRGMLLAAATLSLACPSMGGEVMFTGRVEQVTLRPSGSNGCPPPCEAKPSGAPDSRYVCVSNEGGCQETLVEVDDIVFGDVRRPKTTLHTRTGEWGGTTFPVSRDLILVYADGRSYNWTWATRRDGKLLIDTSRRRMFGGVRLDTLVRDEQGMASLDDLLVHLHRE